MIVISGKRDGELVGKMGGAARGHGKRRANMLFGTRHSEGVLEQCGDDVRYSALRRLCWKGTVRFEDEGIRVFVHSWYGLRSRRTPVSVGSPNANPNISGAASSNPNELQRLYGGGAP